MARLLVLNFDKHSPDTEIDATMVWKKGDVIAVKEDGEEWGALEGPPKALRIEVPGPASDYKYLLYSPTQKPDQITSTAALKIPKINRLLHHVSRPVIAKRRRYKLDTETLEVINKERQ